MAEILNNVRMSHDWDDIKHAWMAFALEDGSSDGTVYDSRADAIRVNRNRSRKLFYVALRTIMHGITAHEATQILALTRVQSERGRYNPREDSQDPITPLTREDYAAELVSTKLGVPWVSPKLGELLP